MPGQAQISSIEAIEAFRADLILFLSQMQPLLDEVSGEVVRMRFWLENERREFWQNQIRRRRRQLEEAQAELFNARLSTLNDSSMLQHLAEQKAKKAVEDAEQKLAAVRRWDRDLENLADPVGVDPRHAAEELLPLGRQADDLHAAVVRQVAAA